MDSGPPSGGPLHPLSRPAGQPGGRVYRAPMASPGISRRGLLKGAGAGLAVGALPLPASSTPDIGPPTGAVAVSSANGLGTVAHAVQRMTEDRLRPVSAAVEGVGIVEADPNDLSVGLGGLPDEDGKVTLDAACMDGPTHNAGSVGAIQDILHPARVAELVQAGR